MYSEEQLLDLRIRDFNTRLGNKPYMDCSICKNRGYLAYKMKYHNNYIMVMRECDCMEERRALAKVDKS